MTNVAFGPSRLGVYVDGKPVGVAQWDGRTWSFRDPKHQRYRILTRLRFFTQQELGHAVEALAQRAETRPRRWRRR